MIIETTLHIRDCIKTVIQDMCKVALANDCQVACTTNNYRIMVNPWDRWEDVLSKFTEEMQRRQEEYNKSPEYKNFLRNVEEQRKIQSEKLQNLSYNLPEFTDIYKVIDWFEKLATCDMVPTTTFSDIPEEFKKHGYGCNMKLPKTQMDDAEQTGRWVVSQGITFIEMSGDLPRIFPYLVNAWKQKFSLDERKI